MPDFERTASARRPPFVAVRDEVFDDSVFDEAAAAAVPSPAEGREGLPPSFRMRHDEHYVDQITSRAGSTPVQVVAVKDIDGAHPFAVGDLSPLVESITSIGVIQPLLVRRRNGRYELIAGAKRLAAAIAAGLTEVPCLLQNVDDARARTIAEADNLRCEDESLARRVTSDQAGVPLAAVGEIVDSLATIESCLNLFLERERPLRERVAIDLMRAEAHRARWLARAYALLGQDPTLVKKPLAATGLVGRALQGLTAEGRLSGVTLAFDIEDPSCTVTADERLIAVALTGAIGAMLALLHEAGGGTLRVHAGTSPATHLFVFQVSQDLVSPPEAQISGLGATELPEWPGGSGTSAGLAVAKRVAELHGGRLEVEPGRRGGCSVKLILPAERP